MQLVKESAASLLLCQEALESFNASWSGVDVSTAEFRAALKVQAAFQAVCDLATVARQRLDLKAQLKSFGCSCTTFLAEARLQFLHYASELRRVDSLAAQLQASTTGQDMLNEIESLGTDIESMLLSPLTLVRACAHVDGLPAAGTGELRGAACGLLKDMQAAVLVHATTEKGSQVEALGVEVAIQCTLPPCGGAPGLSTPQGTQTEPPCPAQGPAAGVPRGSATDPQPGQAHSGQAAQETLDSAHSEQADEALSVHRCIGRAAPSPLLLLSDTREAGPPPSAELCRPVPLRSQTLPSFRTPTTWMHDQHVPSPGRGRSKKHPLMHGKYAKRLEESRHSGALSMLSSSHAYKARLSAILQELEVDFERHAVTPAGPFSPRASSRSTTSRQHQ